MKNLIDRLGAHLLEDNDAKIFTAADFESQTGIRLPYELSSLLEEIGGTVIFDHGAKFIPSSPSGRENEGGYLSLDVLYGFSTGLDGLAERHTMTEDDLPPKVIPIGEAPGGDQICLDLESGIILFWKHDVEQSEAITAIASDITEFFASLEPYADRELIPNREIDEDGSWLNF